MKKIFLILFLVADVWAGDYMGTTLSSAVVPGQTATAAWANDIREDLQRKIWISTEPPATPYEGELYYSTTTGYGIFQWYDGSAWHNIGGYRVAATTITAINANGLYLRSDGLTGGIEVADNGSVYSHGDLSIKRDIPVLQLWGTAVGGNYYEEINLMDKDGYSKGQIRATQAYPDNYMIIQPVEGDHLCFNTGITVPYDASPANADVVMTPQGNIVIHNGDGSGLYGLEVGTSTKITEKIYTSTITAQNANGLYLLDDGGNGIFVKDGGNVRINGATQITAYTVPSSGKGLELGYSSVNDLGQIISYDRDNGAYKTLLANAKDYSFKVSGTEKVTIDSTGKVGISTTSPVELLSVNGNVLADDYLTFSNIYEGDALSAIENIQPEAGQIGEWQKVNHATLPDGVRYEKKYQRKWYKNKKTGEKIPVWKVEKDTTAYNLADYEIIITTETFVGRSLDGNVQLNTRAIKQLYEMIKQQAVEIADLKKRVTILEAKGATP